MATLRVGVPLAGHSNHIEHKDAVWYSGNATTHNLSSRRIMKPTIPVIDLFAGPGGLGEGFSGLTPPRGSRRFATALSVEMEPFAHKTLTLRSFFRRFLPSRRPEAYYRYLRGEISIDELKSQCSEEWAAAERETLCAELGNPEHQPDIDEHLERVRSEQGSSPVVLIGGPPCQAYSLAGRSRNRGNKEYVPEEDSRHTLYLEYLKVIVKTWPAVFVMENVKGILSSTLHGEQMFSRIRSDLENPKPIVKKLGVKVGKKRHTYRLWPVCVPEKTLFEPGTMVFSADDFVVRAERMGIPQRRHRVIIIGVRDDVVASPELVRTNDFGKAPTVGETIGGLPRLRSGLSKKDDPESWRHAVVSVKENGAMDQIGDIAGSDVTKLIRKNATLKASKNLTRGGEFLRARVGAIKNADLRDWLLDPRLKGVCNHSTRGHIEPDLHRYMFASSFASIHGRSPTLKDFPRELYPKHKSATTALKTGNLFSDRFRVQVKNDTSTTIMSHISKDGHYYIHYDPAQCRSLTVREAARLQTFPDNYFFCGPRTSQYVQVGNAVPPLLARSIASVVHKLLRDAELI